MKKLLLLFCIVGLNLSCSSGESGNLLEDVEEKNVYRVIYTQEGDDEAFSQSLTVSGGIKEHPNGYAFFSSDEEPLEKRIDLESEATNEQLGVGYSAIKMGNDDVSLEVSIEIFINGEKVESYETTLGGENLVGGYNYVSPLD